jgi:hypothetical protein
MSKDIESRIKRIEETVEENNDILRKIKRKETFNFWFNVLKILILIGAFYYGYIFLEPFLNQIGDIYQSIKDTANTANEIKGKINIGSDTFDIQKIIQGFSSE